jgi:gliding motility-associated-like protein
MGSKIVVLSVCLLFLLKKSSAQIITTIAGTHGQSGYSGNGGLADIAKFNHPYSIDIDNQGNLYISDGANSVIRKISTSGVVSTLAGNGSYGYSGDGGPAILAQFRYTGSIALDNIGNVFVCENNSNVIRKINTAGIITTIAGNGLFGYNGDGDLATAAEVYATDIAVDNSGNIYFADYAHARIRKINSAGIISTIAGTGAFGTSGDGGPAILAEIIPRGIAVDNSGNVYIADNNFSIRKINSLGIISTIAGVDRIHGYAGDGGPAITAFLDSPYDMDIDEAGNIYIADYGNLRIRKIDGSGIITTIAGTGELGYNGDGGLAILAQITYPTCVIVDKNSNVYFADPTNHTVRKVNSCLNTVNSSLTISTSSTSVCKGDIITFTANPMYGGLSPSYLWKVNGNDAGANNRIFKTSFLEDGDVVTCVMVSSINCTLSVVSSNNIQISIKPNPVITLPAEITILPGSNVQLNAVATGTITQYVWTPGTGLNSNIIASPIASPVNTTTYHVKVVDNNGCMDTAKIKVIVYKKIYIPSAFTPNGDGKNDIFRIPDGTTFDLIEFCIYNRWGELVFKTKNIFEGWNGMYKGVTSLPGTYLYIIKGKDRNSEVLIKSTLMLIR